MKQQLPFKKLIIAVLSLFIAVAVLLTAVPAVYAEGDDPLTPIPGLGRLPDKTLIAMHKKEGTWFNEQEVLLRDAESLSAAFLTLINAQAKAGKDVSILLDGLAVFDSEVATSREIHLTAGASIFSLTGFMVNGNVRDRLAAGASILDGRTSLNDANVRLMIAMTGLRKSYAQWRASRVSDGPRGTISPGIPTYTPQP